MNFKFAGGRTLLVVLCFCLLPSQAMAEAINAGYFTFPPHTMRVKGEDVGPAVEYFKMITQKMNLPEVNPKLFANSRLLNYLGKEDVDFGLVFAKNRKRAASFTYPLKPFGTMVMALALPKSSPLDKIDTVEDILPMDIGYLKDAYLPQILQDKRIRFQFRTGSDWSSQNLLKVHRGRLDAALSDYHALIYEAKVLGILDDVKIIKITGTEVGLYNVMSNAFAERYRTAYEAALEEVGRDLTYDQAFQQFIQTYTE